MEIPIYKVDAFTPVPFQGNPAAVCLLPSPFPDIWLQAMAREMNLSETAFLLPEGDGYRLRWFTPRVEVALCGHATLASAHILYEAEILAADQIARFFSKSGLLTARYQNGWIELDFPVKPVEPAQPPEHLLESLGISATLSVGRSQFDYLIEVENEDIIRQLKPDFSHLKNIPVRGVIVTSRAEGKEYDFVSRFFAPAVGVDEDPVTGSAHCSLAYYWNQRLGLTSFTAYQASERGGFLKVNLAGDRVLLQGQAVTILKGRLVQQQFSK
jgi:PhzF family phenazine biosynthesis protein